MNAKICPQRWCLKNAPHVMVEFAQGRTRDDGFGRSVGKPDQETETLKLEVRSSEFARWAEIRVEPDLVTDDALLTDPVGSPIVEAAWILQRNQTERCFNELSGWFERREIAGPTSGRPRDNEQIDSVFQEPTFQKATVGIMLEIGCIGGYLPAR
jgi:hypothetical protein